MEEEGLDKKMTEKERTNGDYRQVEERTAEVNSSINTGQQWTIKRRYNDNSTETRRNTTNMSRQSSKDEEHAISQ